MTTPDAEGLYAILAYMRDRGVRYVFMEASSHALFYDKLSPIRFACAVFTNLTPEHLDFHKTMENYLLAKLKLFSSANMSVINKDSSVYDRVVLASSRSVLCSAFDPDAEYFACGASSSLSDGTKYKLINNNEIFDISSHLVGDFNVMNTLEAIAAAVELGVDIALAREAVGAFMGVVGRLERILSPHTDDVFVFIDYAHTPDALKNVLHTVSAEKRSDQKLAVLFGCGGDRDKLKRPLMGSIAVKYADLAIITSDNCRCEMPCEIISDIVRGVGEAKNYVVLPLRRDALHLAAYLAFRGYAVLLAGKGHEKYEIIGSEKLPFDERAIMEDLIACQYLESLKGKNTDEDTCG
jgi:UDP-N-acetylmuramoyl-L-alanyl-D-glutamate--2,6-diaminopimelate ligase